MNEGVIAQLKRDMIDAEVKKRLAQMQRALRPKVAAEATRLMTKDANWKAKVARAVRLEIEGVEGLDDLLGYRGSQEVWKVIQKNLVRQVCRGLRAQQ